MSDWLHNLPVGWMALVVFGAAYLVAGAIGAVVNGLSVGERARTFGAHIQGDLGRDIVAARDPLWPLYRVHCRPSLG